MIQAAFSESVLNQNNNSEPVRINDTSVIICRIKEHKAAKQQTLAEVETLVKAKLTTARAQDKAKEMGQTFVARLQKGENPKKVAEENKLTWVNKAALTRRSQDADPTLLATAFRLARGEEGKAAVKGTSMPSGDFLVLTVNRVEAGNIAKMDEKMQQVYNQSLMDVVSQMEYALYANQVMTQAKVDLYTE